MKKTIPLALVAAVLGLSVALALSLTIGSGGGDRVPGRLSAVQDGAPLGPEGQAPLAKADFSQPAGIGGPSEGIKVHGRWTIEVREPDGSLVSRREFDNALELTGAGALSRVLNRTETMGPWEVIIRGSLTDKHPCIFSIGSSLAAGCLIVGSSWLTTSNNVFKTLQVTLGVDGRGLVLSGSASAQREGDIGIVSTFFWQCPATVAPGNCDHPQAQFSGRFTGTTLASPIAVQEGQQILVEVTISFE